MTKLTATIRMASGQYAVAKLTNEERDRLFRSMKDEKPFIYVNSEGEEAWLNTKFIQSVIWGDE